MDYSSMYGKHVRIISGKYKCKCGRVYMETFAGTDDFYINLDAIPLRISVSRSEFIILPNQ